MKTYDNEWICSRVGQQILRILFKLVDEDVGAENWTERSVIEAAKRAYEAGFKAGVDSVLTDVP